jgi:uncharacterized Zn finger protein
MIEVEDGWATTPVVCNICGHKMQLVFECKVIKDGKRESWKLPNDVDCSKCGSFNVTFIDFEDGKK